MLYRKPDGPEWGGQDLENATGGVVTRSFPPALWFEVAGEARVPDDALLASLEYETLRSILEEAQRLRPKDRRLLLGIAHQISSPYKGG